MGSNPTSSAKLGVPMTETTKRVLQVVSAPILGFVFIISLPAIGFGLLAFALILKAKEAMNGLFHRSEGCQI